MLRPIQKNEQPKTIYNPLHRDFMVEMADEKNVQHTFTLHALEAETFPAYIANHIVKHLAEVIYLERTGSKITKESIMPDILKEIEI